MVEIVEIVELVPPVKDWNKTEEATGDFSTETGKPSELTWDVTFLLYEIVD